VQRTIPLAFALCIAGGVTSSATHAEPVRQEALSGRGTSLTAKEKLSGKAADEQRVDDCKVAVDRRGKANRPTECAPAARDTPRPDTTDR
jgi:hypothetical protein